VNNNAEKKIAVNVAIFQKLIKYGIFHLCHHTLMRYLNVCFNFDTICDLDPIPTSPLKQYYYILLPTVIFSFVACVIFFSYQSRQRSNSFLSFVGFPYILPSMTLCNKFPLLNTCTTHVICLSLILATRLLSFFFCLLQHYPIRLLVRPLDVQHVFSTTTFLAPLNSAFQLSSVTMSLWPY